jgi:hypothetical protein
MVAIVIHGRKLSGLCGGGLSWSGSGKLARQEVP